MSDDIDLAALWNVVGRGWPWLLLSLVVGVLVAVTYIVLTAPIYESRAFVRVGKVPTLGALDDFGSLSITLTNLYGQRSSSGNDRDAPYLDETNLKMKDGVLELVTVGRSPEAARDFLQDIVDKILEQHAQYFSDAIKPLRQRLAAIGGQIKLFTKQMRELESLVNRLQSTNAGQASLVAIERSTLLKSLDQLERDRVALQLQIAMPYSRESQLIVAPVRLEKPVAPRTAVALAGGIILGVLSGFFAILLKEFLRKIKSGEELNERRQRNRT